jgi:hypothetical protein
MTSVAVTPYGSSTSARQPGPSRVMGAGKLIAFGFFASARVMPATPSTDRARTTTFDVKGCYITSGAHRTTILTRDANTMWPVPRIAAMCECQSEYR